MIHQFSTRLERCRQLMREAGIDVLLLYKPSNIFYLTGDGRPYAYAMISREGKVALGVPRTDLDDVKTRASFDELAGFEDEAGMVRSIAYHFSYFGIESGVVGLEFNYLTQSMMSMLIHPNCKPEHVVVKDCTHILSELRIRKDEAEIECIKAAASVATTSMFMTIATLKDGMTESQVAALAESHMRKYGADEFWRTYVSSGDRTNLAHGIPTQRKIRKGDLVMIDIHPIVNGYSADMCRTTCVRAPSKEQFDAFDIYLKAQQATTASAKPGVKMSELENVLQSTIGVSYRIYLFGPVIHGVGIEFEEAPLSSRHVFSYGVKEPLPLEENMVIAVGNCGLYMGKWGVRIEDTVLIGKDGPTVLTEYPRKLIR